MNYANPAAAQTLLIALVGFLTVFVVLVLLMCIIVLISKLFGKADAPADKPVQTPAEATDEYTGVRLNGVDDKTAALLMAIVAEQLDKPLDNLRFISIKEVK